MGMKKLSGYKGHLYCVSQEDLDGKTLNPRVPNNFFTKNGYEDKTTKRVCFAPSIDKCLMGLSQNLKGKEFNVYEPDGKYEVYKPDKDSVPDSGITGELWILEPVKLKKVKKIKVIKDTGEDGIPFYYGDNKAELYKWEYETMNESAVLEVAVNSKYLEKGDYCYNLDLWDPYGSNILYITGLSGSGKTTLAIDIAKEFKCNRVELDNIEAYNLRKIIEGGQRQQRYMEVKRDCPGAEKFLDMSHYEVYDNWVDGDQVCVDFMEWFTKKVSGNGKLYIVNGAQIYCHYDPSYFADKPIIIKKSDFYTSMSRRCARKSDDPITYVKKYIKFFNNKDYRATHKKAVQFAKDVAMYNEDTILEDNGIILQNHKCVECGYVSKEIEVKFPKNPEYDRVKKLHPNWDLSKGQLGYIICPKCKTKNDIIISTEACKDLNTARKFVRDVGELAKKYDANYYIVTDGASGTHNNGNSAVKHARDTMKKWEAKHGFDPDEDWSKNESALLEMSRKDMSPDEFGVPDKKKFPLDSEAHVKSAIKFFNYVEPDDEAELARRIKKKAKEYGVVVRCGEKNRLSKYITEEYIKEFMAAGSIGNCAYAVTNGAIKQAAYQNGYEYSVTDHYPYTKKKKMHKNKEQNNVFSEGYVFSGKDFKYKIDDFENGKTNILFITGASGSGKSTTAKGLAKKYNCEYIELDDVINADSFSDDNLKEYNPIMHGFFTSNPVGKKHRHISLKEGVDENDYWEIIPAFLKYAVQHASGKKYIIEGIEIYDCVDAGKVQATFFKPYAMIIKDTSMTKSAIQAISRDIKTAGWEGSNFGLLKYILDDFKVRAHTYRFVRSGANKIKKELKKG